MKVTKNFLAQSNGDLDINSIHDDYNFSETENEVIKRKSENLVIEETANDGEEILKTENNNTGNLVMESQDRHQQITDIIDLSNKNSIFLRSNQLNKKLRQSGFFKNIKIAKLKEIAKNLSYCCLIFCSSLFANNLLRNDILICLVYSEEFIKCEFWKKFLAMMTSMIIYNFGHFLFGFVLIRKLVISKVRRRSILIAYTFMYLISHYIFLIPIYDENFEIPLLSILCVVTLFNGLGFIFLSFFMQINFPLKKIKNYIFFEQAIIIIPGILTILINKLFPLAFEHIKNRERILFIQSILNSFLCIMMKFILKATIFSNNEFIDVRVFQPGANMVLEFLSGFKIGSLMLMEVKNIYFWLDLSALTCQKIIEDTDLIKKVWLKFRGLGVKKPNIQNFEKISSKSKKFKLENKLSILFIIMFYAFSQMKIVYLFPSSIFDYKNNDFVKTESGRLIPDIFSFEKIAIILFFLINRIIIKKFYKKKKSDKRSGEENEGVFHFLELFYMFKYLTMFTGGIELALVTFLEIKKDLFDLYYGLPLLIYKKLF